MASVRITPDNDAVVSEIEIAAPPERVFQALINREQALQWGTKMTSWEMDVRLGGKWRFVSKERTGSGAGKTFDHHGEILELDPPRLLAYSWFADWHEKPLSHRTVVRWELAPTKTGTRLTVTHSGLAEMPAARLGYSQGWPGLLQSIKKFSEQ